MIVKGATIQRQVIAWYNIQLLLTESSGAIINFNQNNVIFFQEM